MDERTALKYTVNFEQLHRNILLNSALYCTQYRKHRIEMLDNLATNFSERSNSEAKSHMYNIITAFQCYVCLL